MVHEEAVMRVALFFMVWGRHNFVFGQGLQKLWLDLAPRAFPLSLRHSAYRSLHAQDFIPWLLKRRRGVCVCACASMVHGSLMVANMTNNF
jgi:hypothetical protein